MELSTLDIPKEEAEKAWKEYARATERFHNDEDAALAAGYKAIAEGKSLIQLSEVMKAGGENEKHLPKLAIARATATWCWVSRAGNGSCRFSSVQNPRNQTNIVNMPPDTYPRIPWRDVPSSWGLRAMVPIVPPQHRPARSPKMTGYHILWEVDEWRQAPRPPGDPALLKHLRGDLWLLLAAWDLTPLEQAVLTERAL